MSYGEVLLLLAGALSVLLLVAFPGYGTLLRLLVALGGRRARKTGDATPPLTLIISAFNEQGVIAEKLENALGLDYPDLTIVVVSDASSDGTDEIVERVAREHDRVRLLRTEKRAGKTLGINQAMETIESPLVVFTDANAIFERDALRCLVRHFADEKTGYVVGAALYSDEPGSTGARTEGRYWARELQVKQLESELSSVVGADGAIYAIRRELYEPLRETDINDFVNPMQIILKGYCGVFEPSARCVEETTGSLRREVQRKRRIVNRSLAGLLRVRSVLNPFRFGRFAIQLWFHKVLRWFGPLIALLILALLSVASVEQEWLRVPVAAVVAACTLLLVLPKLGVSGRGVPILMEGVYAVGVCVATLQAIFDVARGRVAVTWQTRGADVVGPRPRAATYLTLVLALAPIGLVIAEFLADTTWITLLCMSLAVLGAVGHSFIYGLLLRLRNGHVEIPIIEVPDALPDVTLVISAHNEEKVLAEKLENAIQTRYPGRLDIVVASDGSTDRTNEIAESYADRGVRVYYNNPRTGKAGMLRRACATVETDIVVLSDSNAMYAPDAIARLVANMAGADVGAVTGNVRLVDPGVPGADEDVWLSRIEKSLMSLESATGSCASIDGAMVAVRRELVPSYRDGTILDDFVLAMHVANHGARVLYDDLARGRESSVATLRGEYERRARIMAGILQLYQRGIGLPLARSGVLMRFLGHKVWRWCAPWYSLALGAMIINAYGILTAVAILAISATALLLVLAVACGPSVALRKMGYMVVYQMAAVGGLTRAILGSQSGLWKRTER